MSSDIPTKTLRLNKYSVYVGKDDETKGFFYFMLIEKPYTTL